MQYQSNLMALQGPDPPVLSSPTNLDSPGRDLPTPARQDPDLALIHAIRAGEESAFEELVRRHERRLLRLAFNVTHSREDAEEAVQEAFMKTYRHLDKFQENAKFSTWLIRIVLNESLVKLRKRQSQPTVSLDGDQH